MTDPQQTVFISYRRSTSRHLARAVFQDLRANSWDAFLDVNTIDSGAFDRIILNQIAARAHFVVLLSPGALERCVSADDWLRREIEEAMRLQRNIVPIIEEGFDFDKETAYLPDSIREDFRRMNGLRLFHDYFDEAMEKLRMRFLRQPVAGAITPTPTGEYVQVQQKIQAAAAQGAPSREELSAEQHFNQGTALGDGSEAEIAHYTEAIRLNPDYLQAYLTRGEARFERGDYRGAVEDYTEAIRLAPLGNYYYNRGLARKNAGDREGAYTDFATCVEHNPKDMSARMHFGELLYERHDYAAALEQFTLAVQREPRHSRVAWQALTLFKLGQVAQAQKLWNSLVAQEPRFLDPEWLKEKYWWSDSVIDDACALMREL